MCDMSLCTRSSKCDFRQISTTGLLPLGANTKKSIGFLDLLLNLFPLLSLLEQDFSPRLMKGRVRAQHDTCCIEGLLGVGWGIRVNYFK